MAETNNANISIGYALYTEFRKDGHTLQVIYTPESMSVDKNDKITPIYVPSTIWRRQVSAYSPRRPWRAYSQEWKVVNERKETRTANGGSAEVLDTELATKYAIAGLVFMDRTFASLVDQKWELYKEPIVIEFSQEDLEDTRDWNTPNALIRRIMRSRKALGFPDELFDPTPTPAV
jgi:hypothetical protein